MLRHEMTTKIEKVTKWSFWLSGETCWHMRIDAQCDFDRTENSFFYLSEVDCVAWQKSKSEKCLEYILTWGEVSQRDVFSLSIMLAGWYSHWCFTSRASRLSCQEVSDRYLFHVKNTYSLKDCRSFRECRYSEGRRNEEEDGGRCSRGNWYLGCFSWNFLWDIE